jgi:hypothetical protein
VRARAWSGLALSLGQLALMATSLIFSLCLAYAGGVAAVGATALGVLVFQLTCGVLQRALAEATLLASSHADLRADREACRWSVAAALLGGLIGAALAMLLTIAVPGPAAGFAFTYAAGIPFAIALDIGRAAGVASGASRSVFLETAAWLAAQAGLMLFFAAIHSPAGICLAWAVVNVCFFVAAAVQPHRRPALRGLPGWLRARRSVMGAASLDAFLVGLTPVLAMQAAAFVTSAGTLGVIRILQQVFSPLAFVSITLRRVLIYRRRADRPTTTADDLRDGLVSMALMAVGASLLAGALFAGRELVTALAFIPVGAALVAAGWEKAALGLSFGTSLSRFIRGEFDVLLRARYAMLGLTVLAAPLFTVWWGAVGYLTGTSIAMIVYSFLVLALPDRGRSGSAATSAEVGATALDKPGPIGHRV